jgi:hypothetical protein
MSFFVPAGRTADTAIGPRFGITRNYERCRLGARHHPHFII